MPKPATQVRADDEPVSLHFAQVLSKHLPEPAVAGIMGPVFQNYKSQWEKAFQEVVLRSEKAKDRYVHY